MDAIGSALGGEKGQADLLAGMKKQVSEGLADKIGGGDDAGAAAAAGGDKGGLDTEKLKSAATAYAKGEGDVDALKKAATDTASSYAQGLMGGTDKK